MADNTIQVAPRELLVPAQPRLSEDTKRRITQAFCSAYDSALSDRSGVDEEILIAERNWEMVTIERTYPWVGASNVFIPIIPEQLQAVVSATKADVFTPGGFFLMIGQDAQAAMKQRDVQRYYNGLLTTRRGLGKRTWLQEAEDFVFLSGLHGTSYMDVTYLRKKSKQKYVLFEEQIDEQTGQPVVDAEGKPQYKVTPQEVEIMEYDGVLWEPLELRDIVLIPAMAKSIDEAINSGACVRICYYTEDELIQMSADPGDGTKALFDRAAVKEVLRGSVAKGGTEQPQDPRGMETYTDGGIISTTDQPFPDDIDGRLKSTLYEVLRFETKAVDVDNDGVGEHMVFWIHRSPEVYLGGIPFPYHHGRRLTVDLSLMRRPRRALGRGVPGLLRTIQTEYNANFNMGNDASNLRLLPPRWQLEGVKVLGTDDGEWGPGVTFITPSKDAVGILDLADIPRSNEMIRGELAAMAARISNQAPPQSEGPRVTKAGVQAAQAKQSAYQNTISENVRYALADVFELTHALTIQYGPETLNATVMEGGKPREVAIKKEDLELNYLLLIMGMGGPQDPVADRNDRMLLHNMFAQRPDFAGDPMRLYQLDLFLLESFPMADKEMLIGTPEQAQERAQAQQQAQQQQQEMEKMKLEVEMRASMGKAQPPPSGGAPAGPPAPAAPSPGLQDMGMQ